MLDRSVFLRPIAHRGLHDERVGRIENTAAAFDAAAVKGYGIECDLRPARGGLPVVFHDETTERLIGTEQRIADLNSTQIQQLRTQTGGHGVLTFADLLELVAGRVPLLVEIKSEWQPPDIPFLSEIARRALEIAAEICIYTNNEIIVEEMGE